MDKIIIICENCKGRGIVGCRKLTDYHNGLYDHWTEKCEGCGGSGRLLEKTTVSRTAFEPQKAKGKNT